MFCKMISATGRAKVKDYTFEIKSRTYDMHQLIQIYLGTSTVLKVGSFKECVDAAKECVEMMYDITD